jgi:hypothetical protein
MPLVPLEIPPGVFANGTDLQAAGRWRDVSLVRWLEGYMQPVGGWRDRISDVTADPCRAVIAWQQNTGAQWLAFGAASELFVSTGDGTLTDITPADLATGDVDAEVKTGYGYGFYGTSFYGTARPDTGNYSEATTWSLDTWGEYLVACSVTDGRVLEWQLNTSNDAAAVANAPTDNLALMVTEERFLMALGADGNPRKVQWSDREDNTTWTATATNEAGDYLLQTPGQIMAGVRGRGNALILTDADAHTATYSGPPFVYGFERVGSACGLIARRAVAATSTGIFWMGARGFFAFDGATVTPLKCDVADLVFDGVNPSQISKCWAMNLGDFGEVWWFYPSATSSECDKYVSYNYRSGVWSAGSMARTAGVDRGIFRAPILTDSVSNAYDHETGLNYDDSLPYAETGPVSIGVGDQVMKVTQLIPDEVSQGGVTATFKTRFYPNDVEREYGPYTMANPTDVRFTGRQVRMRLTGVQGQDWRAGIMRLDASAGGRR